MDELIDLIATDKSPSEITDQIKDVLYAKASERIEAQNLILHLPCLIQLLMK